MGSSNAFLEFQKMEEETQSLIQEAKKKSKQFPLTQRKLEKKLQDAQTTLDFFRQVPLSVFAELRDRKQPEPTPPEVPAESNIVTADGAEDVGSVEMQPTVTDDTLAEDAGTGEPGAPIQ